MSKTLPLYKVYTTAGYREQLDPLTDETGQEIYTKEELISTIRYQLLGTRGLQNFVIYELKELDEIIEEITLIL